MSDRSFSDPATVGDVQLIGMTNLCLICLAISSTLITGGREASGTAFFALAVMSGIASLLTGYKME